MLKENILKMIITIKYWPGQNRCIYICMYDERELFVIMRAVRYREIFRSLLITFFSHSRYCFWCSYWCRSNMVDQIMIILLVIIIYFYLAYSIWWSRDLRVLMWIPSPTWNYMIIQGMRIGGFMGPNQNFWINKNEIFIVN